MAIKMCSADCAPDILESYWNFLQHPLSPFEMREMRTRGHINEQLIFGKCGCLFVVVDLEAVCDPLNIASAVQFPEPTERLPKNTPLFMHKFVVIGNMFISHIEAPLISLSEFLAGCTSYFFPLHSQHFCLTSMGALLINSYPPYRGTSIGYLRIWMKLLSGTILTH